MSDSAKILVTGGSGHLGANLVRRLIADGLGGRVRALYRSGSNNSALDGLEIERVEGDLRDAAAMRRAVAGVDRVYHCAARLSTVLGGERDIFESNVVGTRNLLTAAREAGVRKVVVTGSFSAVGHLHDRPSDETVPFYPFEDALPYEFTKALVEAECWSAAAAGIDVVVATSCAILGPHDHKPSRMGEVVLSFARGKLPAYIPGGFEFVASRDIVEGHILAMEKGRSGRKYIFASGYHTLDDLFGHLEEITGTPRPRLRLPAPLMGAIAAVTSPIMSRLFPSKPQRITPHAVRLLTMGRRADVTRARTELGFRPTPIKEALAAAYEDFVRRGLLVPRPRRALGTAAPVDTTAREEIR